MMYDELIELMRYCANDNPVCEKSESCPFYNQAEEDYGYYFCVERMLKQAADAIEDLITALTASNEVIAKNKPKWIPVTERLPDEYERVLTCDEKENIHIMSHTKRYEYPFGINPEHPRYFMPKWWMPLPEPPKDGEE